MLPECVPAPLPIIDRAGECVMISFEKKKRDLPQPVAGEAELNRFDRIRKLAAEKHRKSDSTRPSDRPAAEDVA
jgi:hypothetical protein